MNSKIIKLGLKRIMAFSVDYLLIALWAVLLFVVSTFLLADFETWKILFSNSFSAHILSFLSLTVPVLLYFTISESGKIGSTLGKKLLKLKVVKKDNKEKMGTFNNVLIRNLVKFLPWELSHTLIHYGNLDGLDQNQTTQIITMAGLVFAMLISIVYLAELFFRSDGRPLYDRISGLTVLSA